jgi:hypothetical protein
MTKTKNMEFTFQNFENEYNFYKQNENIIFTGIDNTNTSNERITHVEKVFIEFQNLDVKMRLAFGISEIQLNNNFVSNKEGDLKLCHLLYYKLADLWFAYETYIKFFALVVGTGKNKIIWLDKAAHNIYAISPTIVTALTLVNSKLDTTYNSNAKWNELIEYLKYCEQQAIGYQKRRLTKIIAKVRNTPFPLTHSETLTIIYAIRNNFVHNGETTIVPGNFGYKNKSKLLKIFYPYLCLVLLKATNITCRRV